ncbi:methyl-accepting chemotaxis protein [Cupriavidus sp. CuC1]|uniref:methyl-accepting chemotaxis protein n=1 Tax=Cupriavidus sp. CuC1 TaxID=3373131 RepID=UPI0037D66280
MMQKLRISTSLSAVLILFVLLTAVNNFVAWRGLRNTAESLGRMSVVTAELQAVNAAFASTQRARVSLAAGQSATRVGDESAAKDLLKTVTIRLEQGQKEIEAFAKMQRSNPEEQELSKKLVSTYRSLNDSVKSERQAVVSGDTAAYDRISATQSIAASRTFNAELEKLVKRSEARGEEAQADAGRTLARLQAVIVIVVVLTVLVAALVRWALVVIVQRPLQEVGKHLDHVASGDLTASLEQQSDNEIGVLVAAARRMQESLIQVIGTVRASTESVSTASRQIAAGNEDLSARTEQQASSLEETAASMEELTSTVKQNADNARQANQLAVSASEVATKGGAVVSQVVQTMGSITDASKKIVEIIGVIDSIAFQTNILALNAAVEAARAGEQGRGFAVVASEVRNLALRSAGAAREIKALIDSSVDKVSVGSKLVGEAGATMEEIVASVKRVTDIMGEITAATQEQSLGIEQVSEAIVQIDEVTQQNAALVEEASAAAQSMQDQASNLIRAVSVFKVGGMQPPASIAIGRPASSTAKARAPGLSALAKASPKRLAVAGKGVQSWQAVNGADSANA